VNVPAETLDVTTLPLRTETDLRPIGEASPHGAEDTSDPDGADWTIAELYQQELQRGLSFQRAMDATRNLAIGIVAAMALVVFGLPDASHLVLFLGSLTVFALALVETRTHRFAEVSETRLRAIEQNYFAHMLDPSVLPAAGWRRQLAANLAHFGPALGFAEAFAARISRNYFLIFIALDACWFSKLYLYPSPAVTLIEFVHRADLGVLPGWLVLSVVLPVWGTYIVLIVWLLGKQSGREPRY
jgi:uncharacterized membrane protein